MRTLGVWCILLEVIMCNNKLEIILKCHFNQRSGPELIIFCPPPPPRDRFLLAVSVLRLMSISMLKLKNSSFYNGKRWWTMNSSPSSKPALTALIACVSLFSHNPTRLLTSCQSLLHVHLIIKSSPVRYLQYTQIMSWMSLFAIFNFCSPFDIEKMKEYKKCADLFTKRYY